MRTIRIQVKADVRHCGSCAMADDTDTDSPYCHAYHWSQGGGLVRDGDSGLLRCAECLAADVSDEPCPDTVPAPSAWPAEPEAQDDEEILVEFDGIEMQPAPRAGEEQ